MQLRTAHIRRRLDITQEQLAEAAGLDRSSISRLEAGTMGWTHSTLKILAAALNVPQHELLGYSEPPNMDLSEIQRDLIRLVSRLEDRACSVVMQTAQALEAQGMVRDEDGTNPLPDPPNERPRPSQVDWPMLITQLWERAGSGQELAAKLGVSPSTVTYWAQGARRPNRWMRARLLSWATELGIEPAAVSST